MKAWFIGWVGLKRMLRERSNIFFVFVLPIAIIILIGAQFGSSNPGVRLAVSHDGGELARVVVQNLAGSGGVRVERVADESSVVAAVEKGRAVAGVVIPNGLDALVRRRVAAPVGFVARPDSPGTLRTVLAESLTEATAALRVARLAAEATGRSVDEVLATVEAIEVAGVDVETHTLGERLFPADLGQFSLGAAQQLVLFVFLTTLTGSAALIQSRQLGVTRRMLASPTRPATVILGEGLGRLLVGVFQGAYIIGVTLVAFGVDWGDPLAGAILLVAFAATGAGAAMLMGATFRNDQQAGGIAVMAGLGLAALGGCMLPLELFTPTMRTLAHATPHAWAVEGFAELVYRGGSLGDITTEVAVLGAYAAVLVAIASWRLRRVMTAA